MVVTLLSYYEGKEVINLEIILEVMREILKGIVREIAAHVFRKNVLDNKKTTPRRSKQKGGPQNNN